MSFALGSRRAVLVANLVAGVALAPGAESDAMPKKKGGGGRQARKTGSTRRPASTSTVGNAPKWNPLERWRPIHDQDRLRRGNSEMVHSEGQDHLAEGVWLLAGQARTHLTTKKSQQVILGGAKFGVQAHKLRNAGMTDKAEVMEAQVAARRAMAHAGEHLFPLDDFLGAQPASSAAADQGHTAQLPAEIQRHLVEYGLSESAFRADRLEGLPEIFIRVMGLAAGRAYWVGKDGSMHKFAVPEAAAEIERDALAYAGRVLRMGLDLAGDLHAGGRSLPVEMRRKLREGFAGEAQGAEAHGDPLAQRMLEWVIKASSAAINDIDRGPAVSEPWLKFKAQVETERTAAEDLRSQIQQARTEQLRREQAEQDRKAIYHPERDPGALDRFRRGLSPYDPSPTDDRRLNGLKKKAGAAHLAKNLRTAASFFGVKQPQYSRKPSPKVQGVLAEIVLTQSALDIDRGHYQQAFEDCFALSEGTANYRGQTEMQPLREMHPIALPELAPPAKEAARLLAARALRRALLAAVRVANREADAAVVTPEFPHDDPSEVALRAADWVWRASAAGVERLGSSRPGDAGWRAFKDRLQGLWGKAQSLSEEVEAARSKGTAEPAEGKDSYQELLQLLMEQEGSG